MPRKGIGQYPAQWPAFAMRLKEEAGWRCVRCQHPHDPATGYTLTVHHGTMNKAQPFDHWWAFWVLCQRCHLSVQHRVNLDRPWVMAEHSEWFRVFAAGWYAWKYLGQTLSREDVEARLDELLALERAHVLGELASTGPPGLALVGGTM